MPKIIAVIIELFALICAMWVMVFLSTLWHELWHSLGYMLAAGDRHRRQMGSKSSMFVSDVENLQIGILTVDKECRIIYNECTACKQGGNSR